MIIFNIDAFSVFGLYNYPLSSIMPTLYLPFVWSGAFIFLVFWNRVLTKAGAAPPIKHLRIPIAVFPPPPPAPPPTPTYSCHRAAFPYAPVNTLSFLFPDRHHHLLRPGDSSHHLLRLGHQLCRPRRFLRRRRLHLDHFQPDLALLLDLHQSRSLAHSCLPQADDSASGQHRSPSDCDEPLHPRPGPPHSPGHHLRRCWNGVHHELGSDSFFLFCLNRNPNPTLSFTLT